jgi:16S rRNA processing protein RimM
LKGECTVFPLTDAPEVVYAKGRSLWLTDVAGSVVAGPLVVARSRPYHREWLVAFDGHPDRSSVEGWHDVLLAAPVEALDPPGEGEVYLHELAGFVVEGADGRPLGVVTAAEELPAGVTLEVQGRKREFLLPYRKEFVRLVDRERRRLVVELPDGLID